MKNENKRVKYNKENDNIMYMPNNVFRIITNTSTFKLYCYLCNACNEDGEIRESYKTISNNIKISIPTILKSIKELESLELITKETTNDNEINLYTLYMPTENEMPIKKSEIKSNHNP